MEAAKPIISTPQQIEEPKNINFIEELMINQKNKNYKIQFGINESSNTPNQLILKVSPVDIKFFYFQNIFDMFQLQSISKIFSFYENIKEIISFLKTLTYEIQEKDESINLIFNIFLPNGQNKLIELNLQKKFLNSDNIITDLLKENKLLKNEISLLKEQVSKNTNEISLLKEQISIIINQNKSLCEEFNKLKEKNKIASLNISFDCKIFNSSINEINFILDYIRENDKSFCFNDINLLYRASRDGDRTETCHKLCDDIKNVLIIIKSEKGYIFGGYCKIGFKINPNRDFKIDNYCFLFSYQLRKIYPVIENKKVICHINNTFGLCFFGSLVFEDNFMKYENNRVNAGTTCFTGFSERYEMNGGKCGFKVQELEVFQLTVK